MYLGVVSLCKVSAQHIVDAQQNINPCSHQKYHLKLPGVVSCDMFTCFYKHPHSFDFVLPPGYKEHTLHPSVVPMYTLSPQQSTLSVLPVTPQSTLQSFPVTKLLFHTSTRQLPITLWHNQQSFPLHVCEWGHLHFKKLLFLVLHTLNCFFHLIPETRVVVDWWRFSGGT